MDFSTLIMQIDNILWATPLIILTFGLALIYCIAIKFGNVTNIKLQWKLLTKGESSEEGLSAFETFCSVAAYRVAVGNIGGVMVAIMYGGRRKKSISHVCCSIPHRSPLQRCLYLFYCKPLPAMLQCVPCKIWSKFVNYSEYIGKISSVSSSVPLYIATPWLSAYCFAVSNAARIFSSFG